MLTIMLTFAAAAQPGSPAPCTPAYPPALAAWPQAYPAPQGFVIGHAVDLTAVPVATVRLAVRPSKPLTGAYLASGTFTVATAGTYTVAAGGTTAPVKPLWLDVAGADGKPLASVAHGHGAACTSITKAVDFVLKPGRYTFLATGLTGATPVRVLIVRK